MFGGRFLAHWVANFNPIWQPIFGGRFGPFGGQFLAHLVTNYWPIWLPIFGPYDRPIALFKFNHQDLSF
jgi:hypothetical protein